MLQKGGKILQNLLIAVPKKFFSFQSKQDALLKDIKNNEKFFIWYTKPKNNMESKEILLLRLSKINDIKNFITFYTSNDNNYNNIVIKKFSMSHL